MCSRMAIIQKRLGRYAIQIYDAFTWAEAVVADEDHGIVGHPAEDRSNIETVFAKLDMYFGVHNID